MIWAAGVGLQLSVNRNRHTFWETLHRIMVVVGLKGYYMKIGLAILSTFLFAACSKTSNSPTSSQDVSFSSQVQPIFTSSCALSGCHSGSNPTGGQDLSAGKAYNNIVSKASTEVPGYFRVKPFSSDSSYLYMKITGDSRITGVRMPNGGAPLSQSNIQTIKNWIDEGAQNN